MKFNFKDFSLQREIQKRVDLEDLVRWAQKPTPVWAPIQGLPESKKKTSRAVARHFIQGLLP